MRRNAGFTEGITEDLHGKHVKEVLDMVQEQIYTLPKCFSSEFLPSPGAQGMRLSRRLAYCAQYGSPFRMCVGLVPGPMMHGR